MKASENTCQYKGNQTFEFGSVGVATAVTSGCILVFDTKRIKPMAIDCAAIPHGFYMAGCAHQQLDPVLKASLFEQGRRWFPILSAAASLA